VFTYGSQVKSNKLVIHRMMHMGWAKNEKPIFCLFCFKFKFYHLHSLFPYCSFKPSERWRHKSGRA